MPSEIDEEPNNANIIIENNQNPVYPVLENNQNNNNNKGFSENLDWNNNNDNIVMQNRGKFNQKENNDFNDNNNNNNTPNQSNGQPVNIKNNAENSGSGADDVRTIEINLDTLDESVCETIVY